MFMYVSVNHRTAIPMYIVCEATQAQRRIDSLDREVNMLKSAMDAVYHGTHCANFPAMRC